MKTYTEEGLVRTTLCYVERDGCWLMLHRVKKKQDLNQGKWIGIGGHVEPGETPEQALAREIREELDTEIEVGTLIDTIETDYPNFHLSMGCYFCSVLSGRLTLLEHENAAWLAADDLNSVAWLPADLSIIPKLKEELAKRG